MIHHKIQMAISYWREENKGKYYSEAHSHRFFKITEELQDSIATWSSNVTDLLSIYNWNLPILSNEHGEFRLPKAYLNIKLTRKDNLILEWYPVNIAETYIPDFSSFNIRNDDRNKTDYRYWTDSWSPGSPMPSNKIVMIRDMAHPYFQRSVGMRPHSHKYLLQAIHEHFRYIVATLSRLIEVELLTDMYLEYKPISKSKDKRQSDTEMEKLVDCNILSIADIRKRENHKWLESTFDAVGFSADDFVKIFADAQGNSRKFVKTLKEKGVKGLGETGAVKIIDKLKKEFPEAYLKNYIENK